MAFNSIRNSRAAGILQYQESRRETQVELSQSTQQHDPDIKEDMRFEEESVGCYRRWCHRRLGFSIHRPPSHIICILVVAAFIPLWILPSDFPGLAAGAFCIQFDVQGAWGVIPIQLAEMSPPAFRATFPGVAYQLGNMVSSASAQIEATGGENLRTTRVKADGTVEDIPDYATVQGILIGVVAAYLLIKHKAAFEEGGGEDDAYIGDEAAGPSRMRAKGDEESGGGSGSASVDEKRKDHLAEKA
ncbi:hypothetical protein VKT23_012408 [Stygiomarasmius scandens]|uniref:Uncharacterized protein n=1 Tax=Marasmiellus scandens TaxID=2682957 RepID=A0ABR1J8M1_9AGAR